MAGTIIKMILDMRSCELYSPELEEKEFLVLQELCGAQDSFDITIIVHALALYGTILSVPVLCALLENTDPPINQLVGGAIKAIRKRAKGQGSFLPDEFFTPEHWRLQWLGSKNAFLTYVQVIAESYIKLGHDESEVNRIGQVLTDEMNIDIAPYQTFADFRVCNTAWDFRKDYRLVLDQMAQEQALAGLGGIGVTESDLSFLKGCLMELQYDYLVARLKLKGNLKYYRLLLKIAESLNQPEL